MSAWRGGEVRRARRAAVDRLAALDLPPGCDVAGLCAHLGRRSGRTIQMVPMSLRGTGVYGMWLRFDVADLVAYEANTSKLHQDHIIAHELAHMICDHRGETLDPRTLFPDLDQGLVRDMLARAGFTDQQELEAEVMATVILERTIRRPAAPAASVPPELADVVARIERSLNPRPDRQ